jgi:hypothetical protein
MAEAQWQGRQGRPNAGFSMGFRAKRRVGDDEPYRLGLLGGRSAVSSGGGGAARPGFDSGGEVALTAFWPPNLVGKLHREVLILLLCSNPNKHRWINALEDLPWRLGFQAFQAKFNLL